MVPGHEQDTPPEGLGPCQGKDQESGREAVLGPESTRDSGARVWGSLGRGLCLPSPGQGVGQSFTLLWRREARESRPATGEPRRGGQAAC